MRHHPSDVAGIRGAWPCKAGNSQERNKKMKKRIACATIGAILIAPYTGAGIAWGCFCFYILAIIPNDLYDHINRVLQGIREPVDPRAWRTPRGWKPPKGWEPPHDWWTLDGYTPSNIWTPMPGWTPPKGWIPPSDTTGWRMKPSQPPPDWTPPGGQPPRISWWRRWT